ncbi:restriction endonuclease subunit S [Acinetobacter baumannii]|uniref:restriction endonuclease subunit S n=2 Tax=Acinetobacter TaxID=469 RepID=UPI002222DB38|nr:restriction endonuclease subunit S [Acinetobacter baumannii]MCW1510461.1 restriction endonuclease subunit S [Acinetobacter baumannii]MDA3360212.1 restriction endonuclease subunit S [Acinetobacter baumannii]MDR9548202.1 restriction endonuclease subunit S [Acinetobacter baumannii]
MVPNGWEKSDLTHLITIKHGFAFKSEFYSDKGQYVLLTPGSFYETGGFRDQGSKTKYYIGDIPDGYILSQGDMLLAMTEQAEGLLGSALFVPENNRYLHNQRLGLVQILNQEKVCKDFLYLFFNSPSIRKQITEQSTGTKVKHTSPDRLCSVIGLIPPLKEQQKIAEIISSWDQAISATERLLENSQEQKKALMQQLLTGKKRLLDENGVRFVGEWEKVHIKDCAECLDNKRVPLNSEQRSLMSGSIPYWGANGIVDYISDFIFDETIVLLAEDGGYFDEYQTRPISNISYGKCWVNNHAHILRAKKNSLNEWIYYCLVHKNILAFVNGGTRAKLNKSDMLMIPLLLPSLLEQKKIVSLLSLADQEIENLQKKLDCLKQEKKALMQLLLTGKKRVKVAA